MLSYQHGYHAGNFADVVKHFTLSRILTYMTRKDKPLFYLDTHAGKGIYDLKDKQALKTGEYINGIQSAWLNRHNLPEVFLPYLNSIQSLNLADKLRYYPGSPALAMHILREQDRLHFCELHPSEFDHLNTVTNRNLKVQFSHDDGLTRLKALLPPPEKRGLIFIDPSFEVKEDFKTLPLAVNEAFLKFSTGTYCIWYPLLDKKLTEQFYKRLQQVESNNVLKLEFQFDKMNNSGMYGCGLWIINPPYVLAAELKEGLNALKKIFNPGISSYFISEH